MSDCYFGRASRRQKQKLGDLLLFSLHIWLLGVRADRVPNTSAVCRSLALCDPPPLHVLRVCDASQPPFVPFRGEFFSLSCSLARSLLLASRGSQLAVSLAQWVGLCATKGRRRAHDTHTHTRCKHSGLGARSRRARSITSHTTREPGHPVVCVTLARGASSAVTWPRCIFRLCARPKP